MTTDITRDERALSDEVQARFGWNLFAAPKHALWRRLNAYWRTHPNASALTSFTLAAVLLGVVVLGYVAHDLAVVSIGYVAALAAGVFGALERHRASVSAGSTR